MTFSQQVSNLINKLKGDVQKIPNIVVEAVSKDMAQTAQRHFNTDLNDVGADDPYVVVSRSVNGNSAEVRCTGNQVLFIEFGAGKYYYTGDTEVRLYQGVIPNIKPRPSTIDDIGHYHLARWGRSRGLDDLWFYKSDTGRESENAHLIKYNRNGDPIMLTHGNRPARA